jgi:hypothetical protein
MELTKTTINKDLSLRISQFSFFLVLMVFAPLIGNQFITGTIVNALLLISSIVLGIQAAFLLAFLPSIFSLLAGTLPAVLAPMIPFIIMGNILFVFVFNKLFKGNYWLGAVSGSLLKFIMLFVASNFLIQFFIKQSVASKIAIMMSWPQFVTAILGSLIAYFVYKLIKK